MTIDELKAQYTQGVMRGNRHDYANDYANDDARIHRAARLSLTGQPIPRCVCGKAVYAEGRCYECYQAKTARSITEPLSSLNEIAKYLTPGNQNVVDGDLIACIRDLAQIRIGQQCRAEHAESDRDALLEAAKHAAMEWRLHGQLTDSCRVLEAAIAKAEGREPAEARAPIHVGVVAIAMSALESDATKAQRAEAWDLLRDAFFPVQPEGREL